MTLIRNEFTKLRTVRGPWVLIAIQQTIIVAGISGLAVSAADLTSRRMMFGLLAHAGVASAIFTLVLGILAVAGEYRHRTITDTFLATPRRGSVVAAKLVAYTIAGVGLGVISAGTGLVMTASWLSLDLSDPDVWGIVAGIVGLNAAYAAIGVSLGALVRNVTGTVIVALTWIALVETTVANLLGDFGRWLPNRAGMALNDMPSAGALLPQWGGGLVLLGYAVVFVVAALATTVRRDVT
jgi:ABC-2 type transport system permease protein